MPGQASPLFNRAQRPPDRRERILEAACRAIARDGSRRVRLQDIAAEAGVSKGLLHYYAESREQLLADTFEFGDERARRRVKQEISDGGSGSERLRKLLHLYFSDETEVREDWMIWSEFSASAVFDEGLRSKMRRAFADWSAWLAQLVGEGVRDGSIVSERPVEEIVADLSALVDGLGLQLVRNLMSAEHARQTLDRAMVSFGLTAPISEDGAHDAEPGDTAIELIAIEGLARATLRRLQRLRASDEHGSQSAKRGTAGSPKAVGGKGSPRTVARAGPSGAGTKMAAKPG
ncbi:MAG: TetR/AcrR family transcriptional regulator [Streptosporangiaceae bacterium]